MMETLLEAAHRWWYDLRLPPMRGTYRDVVLWLDFAHLDGVTIENCKLVYFGLGGVTLRGCEARPCSIKSNDFVFPLRNRAAKEVYYTLAGWGAFSKADA